MAMHPCNHGLNLSRNTSSAQDERNVDLGWEMHLTSVSLLPFSLSFLAATFVVIGILSAALLESLLQRFYLSVLLFKLPLHPLAHVWWS